MILYEISLFFLIYSLNPMYFLLRTHFIVFRKFEYVVYVFWLTAKSLKLLSSVSNIFSISDEVFSFLEFIRGTGLWASHGMSAYVEASLVRRVRWRKAAREGLCDPMEMEVSKEWETAVGLRLKSERWERSGGCIWRIGGIGAFIFPFPLVSWDYLLELGARIR